MCDWMSDCRDHYWIVSEKKAAAVVAGPSAASGGYCSGVWTSCGTIVGRIGGLDQLYKNIHK